MKFLLTKMDISYLIRRETTLVLDAKLVIMIKLPHSFHKHPVI